MSAWERGGRLRIDAVSANRQLVSVSGPTSALGAAFGTRFERFRDAAGRAFTGPAGTPHLPAASARSPAACSA